MEWRGDWRGEEKGTKEQSAAFGNHFFVCLFVYPEEAENDEEEAEVTEVLFSSLLVKYSTVQSLISNSFLFILYV